GTFTFSTTGATSVPYVGQTAALLPNGRVLIAGGVGQPALYSAELYDPAAGTWSLTGSMLTSRYDHTMTLLPSGKVLIAGGYSGTGPTNAAELYDVALGFS